MNFSYCYRKGYNRGVVKNWSNHERIEDHWISFGLQRTIISHLPRLHSFIFLRYPLRLLRVKNHFLRRTCYERSFFTSRVLISFAPPFFFFFWLSNTIVFVYIFHTLIIYCACVQIIIRKNAISLDSSNLSADFRITSRSKWENDTFELISSTSSIIAFVYISPTFIIFASK